MQQQVRQRRPRGTGHLEIRHDRAGRAAYYGKFTVAGRQVMRKLGAARRPGARVGLTRSQAERELQRKIEAERTAPPVIERIDVGEAGGRYLAHLRTLGRKKSTLSDYESTLRVHLAPFFAGRSLDRIDVQLVESFIHAKLREGRNPKSVHNYLWLLHSIFKFAIRRGLASTNPVAAAEKPRAPKRELDVRFLEVEELEALLDAVPKDELGQTERVIYLTAAMTGLRRGELIALRWQDVDFEAGVIPGEAQLHPRRIRQPEDATIKPSGTDGRPRQGRTEQPSDAHVLRL